MENLVFFAALGLILGARVVNERGYRRLSDEEKLRLMDGFSGVRMWSLLPVIVIVLVYLAAIQFTNISPAILLIAYIVVLVIYVALRTVLNMRLRAAWVCPAATSAPS